MAGHDTKLVEEVLRSVAAAANAVRLYPPTSDLPAQAIQRAATVAGQTTAQGGPLRFIVEPKGFKFGESVLCAGQAQVQSLAETLYAHQIGQLVVAPGLAASELRTFVTRVAEDTSAVREAGGIRSVLAESGVAHLAVIEVTLRASTEEGLLGLDLATAPYEDMGQQITAAARRWERSVVTGDGTDELAEALGRLEEATRDLATQRVVEALMHMDEATRLKIMHSSLARDRQGKPMQGMLDVVARMSPASLARLLRLTAARAGAEPQRVLAGLTLPPELAREVGMLLAPSPRSEEDSGVPAEPDVGLIAVEATDESEVDEASIERQKTAANAASAATRALRTTLSLAKTSPSEDTLLAVVEALPVALKARAFEGMREAVAVLSSMASEPAMAGPFAAARHALSDPELLRSVCWAASSSADAETVASLLATAGPAGAEAFVACYSEADAGLRQDLAPVGRKLGDGVIAAAGRQFRTADSNGAKQMVSLLAQMGGRRVVPSLTQALDHLDMHVRREALSALADIDAEESRRALVRTLNHWDPETRRAGVRQIGSARIEEAVQAMLKILQGYYLFERNYELKKEVIESLEAIGSTKALPSLERLASRHFMIGRKNRELQFLARRAVARLREGHD